MRRGPFRYALVAGERVVSRHRSRDRAIDELAARKGHHGQLILQVVEFSGDAPRRGKRCDET